MKSSSTALSDSGTTSAWDRLRDIVALGKPRLSSLVLLTTTGGLWLAPGHLAPARSLLTLGATALVVFAANALNCYLEREVDGRMRRTRDRPLPARRLEPSTALALGIGAVLVAIPVLAWAANGLAAMLGVAAFVSYVAAYTPMKQRTPWALVVGAFPGAIPPLLGWSAVTGRLDAGGLALFFLLFVWQLPHFLAVSVYLREDYERGGLRVLSVVHGEVMARRLALAGAALLIPTSLLLVPVGVADLRYAWIATALGTALLVVTARGSGANAANRWAREVFVGSIGYLTALFVTLAVCAR